ncbi:M20/M25/M40 family metallo-hydrolase [candidate division KSB1 bacterium]|nr:M20/M25/M40 family metallo-hydrolase [candidate division KSB1 bacterium]
MMKLSVIQLAQELIRINSINPKCLSDWAKLGSEKNVADWIASYLSPFGFNCEFTPAASSRPNLIVRHSSFQEQLPTVALEAHMDTVDVDTMFVDPFGGDIRQQRLYGRGACDVKGTMAAMLLAMMEWYEKAHGNFNLIFIGSMGEEAGTIGSRYLTTLKLPLQMILVAEPTLLNPVIGHKGLWRLAIETRGRSCHSSQPMDGFNALYLMIDIMCLLMSDVKPDFEGQSGNTMSLTTIHGGTAVNMVPDHCRLEIDCRFNLNTDIQRERERLFGRLKPLLDMPDDKVKLEELELRPAYLAPKKSVLLKLLHKALVHTHVPHKPLMEPWYSDAGHFGSAGYDTIIWGAGSIAQSHTSDEYVTLEQLQTAVQVLQEFLIQCDKYFLSR